MTYLQTSGYAKSMQNLNLQFSCPVDKGVPNATDSIVSTWWFLNHDEISDRVNCDYFFADKRHDGWLFAREV